MKNIIIVLLSTYLLNLQGQDSLKKSKLNFEVYADLFINGTFNHQASHKISDILYNNNRTNEFAINLAYIKASYLDTNFRVNLAFMTGTYAKDNLASEDDIFKNVFEANIGFKVAKKQNAWIDAGVFNSHIGLEGPVSYDYWTLTRSLLIENVPFYETGIRYTHVSKKEKWSKSIMLLNGWQRITMLSGYSIPALGMQFQWTPSEKTRINYSNFFGSTRPDSSWALRTYHNFFLIQELSKKLSVFADFDIGTDMSSKNVYSVWYGAILKLRYKIDDRYALCYRTEFLEDPNDVLYSDLQFNWLVVANSLNIDRRLNAYSLLRAELKYMHSSDPLFLKDHSNYFGIFLALQVKI